MLIIDAPPLLPVSDAQVLLNSNVIDTVLVVARAGRITRDEIRRARSILDRHLLEPLGLVVAGVRDVAKRYGYEPLTDVSGPAASDGDRGRRGDGDDDGPPPARRGAVGVSARRDA
jgi:Mrp family chromosome partitioning ATPase